MRLLLDTHVVLWRVLGTGRLGPRATETLAGAQEVQVSVVSFAEVGIKVAVGKLEVPSEFEAIVRDTGVRMLPLSPAHGLGVRRLPLHHRDPFDRLLVAQAQAEGLTILTGDVELSRYDVGVVDAAR